MIFAAKKGLERYKGISANMSAAIDYLLKNTREDLPPGKVEIDDNMYMMIQHYDTRAWDKGKFEAHDKYVDIQLYLSGEEFVYVEDRSKLNVSEPYDEEHDVVKFHDAAAPLRLRMTPDTAAIFFPEDGHKPNCMIDNRPESVKKIVMKVKL
ncbi:MAG: YhcH/YjgK/YiaL family protein [Treponema sp.]|jgi:YhcH/YjgK/YiaL family protein|nr:YhcH/YjgK/YiaL family protein [Treponema sp.]